MLRGTAKIGEDTEYKKISDLNINIPDDVIEDIKVTIGKIWIPVLCIWACFWVQGAPESLSKYFFWLISDFFFFSTFFILV